MIKICAIKGFNSIVGVEFRKPKQNWIDIPPFEKIDDFQGRILDKMSRDQRTKAMDRLHTCGIYVTKEGEMIL